MRDFVTLPDEAPELVCAVPTTEARLSVWHGNVLELTGLDLECLVFYFHFDASKVVVALVGATGLRVPRLD